jgi:hypothetical protein
MKPHLLTIFLLQIACIANAQNPNLAPLSGPSPQSFSLSGDKLGDVSGSVNLFTGDLAFPIGLASVPGRNGLNINVAISYSSNVHRQADTWNVEAPTGVVGLGWSFDYPKILVDNKMTGTREDDTYYISEGGSSIELVYIGVSGGIKEYKPKSHQFWIIKYDGTNDKWEITKEDGSKFIYGDKNSNRSTIQWIVTWGNWIGSSNVTTATIQKQQALVWNLSEVKNIWGEALQYTYLNVNQAVGGASGKQHTEASYVSSIKNVFNQSVSFTYADKSTGEYVEPHTENGTNQVDAYQERYEMKFLDYVTVNDADGFLLSKTDLNYSTMGSGDMTKRLLTSVIQYNSINQSLPGYSFTYITSGTDVNLGALSSVTTPTGAKINYTYVKQTITKAVREKKITEIVGYAEPKVWIGPDYVVVTRRQLDVNGDHTAAPRPVLIQVFNWDGEWMEWNLTNETMTGIRIVDDIGGDDLTDLNDRIPDQQKFLITMQKDFFAIAYRSDGASVNTIKIYRKDPKARNGWMNQTFTDSNTDIFLTGNYSLVSGEKFIAFSGRHANIKMFQWNGEEWYKFDKENRDTGRPLTKIVAGHNYIIAHQTETNLISDQIDFFFLTEDDYWVKKSAPVFPDNWTSERSYWYPSSSFAAVMADDNNEFIYHWDENYNIQTPFNTGIGIPDNSFVDVINNSMIGILTTDPFPVGHSFRFNGQSWLAGGNMDYGGYNGNMDYLGYNIYLRSIQSYGDDFIVRPRPTSKIGLRKYNANDGTWSDSDITTSNAWLLFAGNNYFTAVDPTDDTKARLYMKKPDGSFVMDPVAMTGLRRANNSPSGFHEARFGWQGGFDFVIKSMNYTGYSTGLLQSIKFRNGKIGSQIGFKASYQVGSNTISMTDDDPVIHEIEYLDPTRVMATRNTLVTFLSSKVTLEGEKIRQSSARELRLHRIIDTEAIGYLVDYPVETIQQNDGEKTTSSYLLFDANKALYDVSGSICQYNKAIVYPGVAYQDNTNGLIENYFFNGISNAIAGNNFPAGPINYDSYNNVVKGLSYRTETFNSTMTSVSKTTSAPIVLEKDIIVKRSSSGLTFFFGVGKSYYIRNHTVSQSVDNISTTTVVQTNTTNGLPSSKTTTYPGKTIVENYKYWYEQYDASATKNILSPLIQSKATVDGTVVGCEVVKYKNWGTNLIPAPWKTYGWKRTGSSDFTAWSDATNPSIDWRLNTTIDVMDEAKGLVRQITDFQGNKNSMLWASSRPYPLAKVSLAGLTEIFYEGFEYNASATTLDAKTGVKSYWTTFTVILPSAGTFKLTYWKKSSGGTWELVEQTITANTTIGASGTLIDEIRLHPANADMVTYAYDRYGNVLTECDANNVIMYNEYDEFQRTILVRDKDKNILKSNHYKIKNQ